MRTVYLLTFATLMAACSAETKEKTSTSAGNAAAETSPSAAAPAGGAATPGATSPCLMEGAWTPCAIEDRLVHAGVVLDRQAEPVRHPFFTVPGTVYHIGNPEHELQVFLYPTAADRERETAALDSATASPKGTRVIWRTPPTLVTSNNMAAVILSLNDRTVERLALALAAGLPQPEKR